MKTTVIYHSADFDGLFCREVAHNFLFDKDVEYIGWDYRDDPIPFPSEGIVYILDLSPECFMDFVGFHLPGCDPQVLLAPEDRLRMVWIDHHMTAMMRWPDNIPGYRINGVAACRLAWAWFATLQKNTGAPDAVLNSRLALDVLPDKQAFFDRTVTEPHAVRLAGEYDIWDKRDPDAETFQFGLRSQELTPENWRDLLKVNYDGNGLLGALLHNGRTIQAYQQKLDASLVKNRSYRLDWEGLNFIVLNTGRFNSLTFAALDVPETGHDALMGYSFDGKKFVVSLYHAKHRTDLDLSAIAVKYGGGGHKGACGFTCAELPWMKEKLLPAC